MFSDINGDLFIAFQLYILGEVLLPSDGSYHRIVVGIALLAYAASERMKAAGAENISNADAYAMALIRGTIAP